MITNDDVIVLGNHAGKTIETVRMSDNTLSIVLVDGAVLAFSDNGQDCCEHRYMTCDDDLDGWTGAKLIAARIRRVDNAEATDNSHDDVHEIQFLRIATDRGDIVVCTHNEHNGYYGGFNVVMAVSP